MTKRKTFVTGALAGATVCTLILACSNSSTPPGTTPPSTTPPGATAESSPPYPSCANLDQGCFQMSGNTGYSAPATTSCAAPGKPTSGAADTHCAGQPPTVVVGGTCGGDAGTAPSDDAGAPSDNDAGDAGPSSDDAGPQPAPGQCGENGADYGGTMFGTDGDDDDCKYHVSYTASPICQNNGTYFVVTASYLAAGGGPVRGACTLAELCLNDTHPAPAIDGRPPHGQQQVVEGPPGTYTIGPVQFDAPGDWTVRFHFNEFCCDVPGSPHGHAAFHVTVP